MNKDVTLQTNAGDNLYPITRAINVFNSNNQNIEQVLNSKQSNLTAGTGIRIENNIISATGNIALIAGPGIEITSDQNGDTISLGYNLATAQDIEDLFV